MTFDGNAAPAVPEEAVVDATRFDPRTASRLLEAFHERWAGATQRARLTDFAREHKIPTDRLERLITALIGCGVLRDDGLNLSLAVPTSHANRYAAVLRGVAYEQYGHRDANQVEVSLSPPAHPSRLMEILPTQDFSWARLHDTKDNLFELANSACARFTILSPFFDREGLAWILDLFEASRPRQIERTLIVRGREMDEVRLLREYSARFSVLRAKILSYSIAHDRERRSPATETFHAKMLVADTDRAYIGSANMNQASRDYSMECGVMISGPCVRPVASLVQAICMIAKPIQLTDGTMPD
jgi:phosphatidylserine/phosphatidylglycerophosphate/cardiolipin synthase-like enzyme